MTKVLIITNKSDITSDFIVKRLKERNVTFYRFNTEELSKSCFICFDFCKDVYFIKDKNINKTFNIKEFSSVYFRRPELPEIFSGDLTQGEILFVKNELLYTLEGLYKLLKDAFWISPLYAIREAENKIYQLVLAKSLGFIIPDSIITNILQKAQTFYDRNKKNCIIKPIKSGLIEDDEPKVVFTSLLKERPNCKDEIEFIPNFLQSNIIKKYDVRVTVVGNKVFPVYIHSQNNSLTTIDWRRGEEPLKHTIFELPKEIEEKCINLVNHLELSFAAIDFICDIKGNFIFLEINPNGQWAWIEKQTGYDISGEIVNQLEYGHIKEHS